MGYPTHVDKAGGGSIDAGIAAARWSPDEELLVVVTKAGSVIFMGSTFDPASELTLNADQMTMAAERNLGLW